MDAFYAAIEVRENPSLAGRPVIIGRRGGRGVVSTCSYEARAFGVRSAMPSTVADRLCPEAIWVGGRMALYVEVSRAIRAILDRYSPLIEPLSIDEAFVDLTGIAADLQQGLEAARAMQRAIHEEQRLTASVGIAPNKFLAKIASDMNKPHGTTTLSQACLAEKLWPLPIERLWGVGPQTATRLKRGGIERIGQLLEVEARALAALVGESQAEHFRLLARGEDRRPVRKGRQARSISEERTYGRDLQQAEQIDRALLARSEGVARQLRRKGLVGRTVQIKIRDGRFRTWTRSKTLPAATDLTEIILGAARELYAERIRLLDRGLRLIGVGVSGLEPLGRGQVELFEAPGEPQARKRARASDAVRDRLGEQALTRARLLDGRGDRRMPRERSSLPTVD